MKLKTSILGLLLSLVVIAGPSVASDGLIDKIADIDRRLACAEARLGRAPVLEEVGRTAMTELRMTSDTRDRDLPDSRLELDKAVRGRQIMIQYNFARFLQTATGDRWIMYRLIVDGVERPEARAIVSARHATHSGVWIGEIPSGETPVAIEFEYAAYNLAQGTRKVNVPYNPVDGVGGKYQAYDAAQMTAFLLSPAPEETCDAP